MVMGLMGLPMACVWGLAEDTNWITIFMVGGGLGSTGKASG